MKISTREIVLLTVLLLMLLSGAYYMFYYVPSSDEITMLQDSINKKTTQIDGASITLLRMQSLALRKEHLEEEFADVSKYLHEDIYDADILRLIERIIAPYTDTMNIEFDNRKTGTSEKAGLMSMRTVHVSMSTTYNDLQEIIKAFSEEDVASRIVEFTNSSYYNEFAKNDDLEMSVNISIEFLLK